MCLSKEATRALDRMDDMARIWRAFGDLMIPETDLHIVNRDNLAIAIDVIRRDYEAARDAFEAAIDEMRHSPARGAGGIPPDRQHGCQHTQALSGAELPDGGY